MKKLTLQNQKKISIMKYLVLLKKEKYKHPTEQEKRRSQRIPEFSLSILQRNPSIR